MNRVMKDSGIEWIGEIPENWKIVSLKRLGTPLTGSTPSKSRQEYWNGRIPWVSAKDIKSNYIFDSEDHITKEAVDECGLTVFETGTLIFCVRSGILRHTFPVSVSSIPVTINQDLRALNPSEETNTAFLLYYMRGMNDTIVNLYQKIGATVESIEMDWFLYFPIVLPPLFEQNQIVELIGKKCAEIDSLIASKEKTNSLLKEWRQSIIYEAVTKGLDPNVPMKNSGIEWIGKIPENWNVVRIKYILDESEYGIKIGPFGSALSNRTLLFGAYCVYSQANLITNDFSEANHYIDRETFEMLQNYEVVSGDICVSMMGTIGKCKEVPIGIKQGIMDSHLIKIRLNNNKVNSGYFEYVYDKDYSGVCFTQMKYEKKGTIMDGLNTSIVKNLFIPLPPLSVQKKIASYLDKKCEKIDSAIKKNTEIVEKLKEYRQSLIYEAVTGKIEV